MSSRDIGSSADQLMTRLMAKLAHASLATAFGGGLIALSLVLLADAAARSVEIRLVPLYVPVLCVASWALRRWPALLFAIVAAVIAILPDIMASSNPIGPGTIVNAAVRALAYIFLALIVTAYRQTYDEADVRAMYDGLTGVLNKLPFQAAIERQLASARRSRETLLIAFVDLDGFKAVNTARGHAAGDGVLQSFSRDAQAAIRGSDVVGRLGGDEFGFMLAAASAANAEALAYVLHQRLATALTKTGFNLSCSMGGLIVSPHAGLNGATLLDMADGMMLQVKADGKGRVITRRAAASDAIAVDG